MAALSAPGFAALFWGVVGLVLVVFAVQLYAIARDVGWPPWPRGPRK